VPKEKLLVFRAIFSKSVVVFEKQFCSSMIRSLLKVLVKENHFKKIVELGDKREAC
jgi:hypothetical protein